MWNFTVRRGLKYESLLIQAHHTNIMTYNNFSSIFHISSKEHSPHHKKAAYNLVYNLAPSS